MAGVRGPALPPISELRPAMTPWYRQSDFWILIGLSLCLVAVCGFMVVGLTWLFGAWR